MNGHRKIFAWLTMLMMLINLLPAVSFADTSDVFGSQTGSDVAALSDGTATATQVVQDAIANNVDNPYVSVTNVKVTPSSGAVPTGDPYHYTVYYSLKSSPVYYPNPDNPTVASSYAQYDQVVFTLTPPAHIELSGAGITDNGDGTYTYTLLNQNVSSGGISGSFEITARMTDNGDAPANTDYGALGVSAFADVTAVDNPGVTLTYNVVPVSGNVSNVRNTASGTWGVVKTAGTSDPVVDHEAGTVTFTYLLEVGKTDVNGDLLKTADNYNVTGSLKFTSFTLTDTPAAFEDIDHNLISRTGNWTITPLTTSGIAIPEEAVTGDSATLSIGYYNTITGTGNAGGATVTGSDTEAVPLPMYTKYSVTVSYPLSPLIAPYELPETTFTLTNATTLTAALVGDVPQAGEDSAQIIYAKIIDPGYIRVQQFLQLDGENKAYDSFYRSFFPGASYAVYHAADFDTATGTATGTAIETFEMDDLSITSGKLKPGDYIVVQTQAPKDGNTNAPLPLVDETGVSLSQSWQAVTVVSSQTPVTVSFYNKLSSQGLVKLKKVKADGSAFQNVTFTLLPDGATEGYTGVTNAQGVAYILAPVGTYTLRETAPAGYLRAADQTITLQEGVTLDITGTPIVNVPNTASLTVTKYSVLNQREDRTYAEGDATAISAVAGVDTTQFSFTLKYSTDNTFPAESTTTQTITLGAGRSSQALSGLPRAASDGHTLYWYQLTENTPGDPAFSADDYTYLWQYTDSASQACDFYDQLFSTLTFYKVSQIPATGLLGITEAADKDRLFTLYRKNADDTYTQVGDTLITGSNGKATTGLLPIQDDNGAIAYYLVETPVEGFTVTYPTTATITVDEQTVSAWGPITLLASKTNDLTSSKIINSKNMGQILLYKRQAPDKTTNLAGAEFAVYYLEGDPLTTVYFADSLNHPFTTTGTGVLVNHLPIGRTYYIEELTAPAGYRKDSTPNPITVDLHTPLQQETRIFYDNKKPTLTVKKTVQDPTTGANTSFKGTFGFSLYRWNETTSTMEWVADYLNISSTANVSSLSTAAMVVEENGTNYFVLETTYPDNLIPPEVLNNTGVGRLVGTDFYYSVSALADNGAVTLTVQNKLNKGKITINKKDLKTGLALAGASYTISVANPDEKAQVLLAAQGFVQDAVDATLLTATVSMGTNSTVTVTGLPVYNEAGAKLTYSVVEATAPAGYRLPDDNSPRLFTLADLTKYSATTTYSDPPYATLTALKLYYRDWEQLNNPLLYPLEGASLALYLVKDGKLAYVNSSETPVLITNAVGQAVFTQLDGTQTYMVVEMAPPEGYDLPAGKTGFSSYDALVNMTASTALSTYNAAVYSLSGAANNIYIVDKDHALQNAKPYAQFRITKVDDANHEILLDYAKFNLYSCSADTLEHYRDLGYSDAELFTVISDAGLMTRDPYVYETGTGLTSSGVKAPGVFQTKALEYGRAYWIKETKAPYNYSIIASNNPYGPLTADNSASEYRYAHSAITEVTLANHNETGGGGSGTTVIRYFQIHVNKKLVNEAGTFLRNLAGVTFELYIADSDFQPQGSMLTEFTTGLDTTVANYASVAGRGISETLEFSSLYAAYPDLITCTPDPDSAVYSCQYQANFVLKEKNYPGNVTPTGVWYPLTVNTADDTGNTIENHTYDNAGGTDGSILNIMVQATPVRVRKLGYTVPRTESSTLTPLAGVQIGIYSDAACANLVVSALTDELGYASFTLEPNTHFWYREINAAGAYDLNSTIYDFQTGGYGAELQTLVLEDPAYRVLRLTKKNADGTQVAGVQLQIVKAAGDDPIVDTNGVAYPTGEDTVTTAAANPASILLPYSINGDYGVMELSVPGETLTAADKLNFKLANQFTGALPVQFGEDEAERTVTLVNPDKARFILTKQDDNGMPMSNVAFQVSFKSFILADLEPTVTTTDNSGWTSAGTWTTDANGQIAQDGLTAGWYRLVETLPAGYVEEGVAARTLLVKMTAKGIGQNTTDPITRLVTNIRQGYLTISKSFAGSFMETLPSQVIFSLFTDEACLTPASPATISVSISGGSGSQQTVLNPGTYYLTEANGAWYGKYSLNGDSENWVNGAIRITVTSDDTADAPVTLAVVNRPSLAAVSMKKVDDLGDPVSGAKFALYYLDGNDRYYYHNGTRTWTTDTAERAEWTTDADGLTTIGITLPFARLMDNESATDYYIQEVEAPAELEFAADRQITLSQDANTLDITADPLVDLGGLYINLTKYGRTHEYATGGDTLAGAEFTLYIYNGSTVVKKYALTTAADGTLQFPNLKRLTGDQVYALAETVTPAGFVEGLTEVYLNDAPITPVEIEIGGVTRKLFPITQTQTVAIHAYNTPTGRLALLKYNYLEPSSSVSTDIPNYAIFSVKLVDENDNVLETINDRVIVTRYEAGDPDMLIGGIAKDASTGLYKDGNGWYYVDYVLSDLAPGRYLVHEEQQAQYFYYTPNSKESDPWYPTRTVVVDDNGGVSVCTFANIPKPEAPKLNITKAVTAMNGDTSLTLLPSLQDGWQKVTYQIAGYARTMNDEPIQLPTDWLELSDTELTFSDRNNQNVTSVEHYVQSVTLGTARYEATLLNPSPTAEIIYASVYGVTAGGTETLLTTRNVADTSQKVTFPENQYTGFRVRYGTNNNGSVNVGLKAGFTANPVTVDMLFRQSDDATVVPAARITNRAAVQLKYQLGGIDSISSGWTVDVAEADVEPKPTLPRVTITKTCDKLSVKPQDTVTYTLTVSNVSTDDAGLVDPVVIDLMPEQLEYSLTNVTWATLPSGMTVEAPATNGDYLYVKFHGTLAAGQSIRVYVQAVVRTAAEASDSFTNTAYVTSTATVNRNVDNPTGTSFTDNAGNLPDLSNSLSGAIIDGDEDTYLTLLAQTSNTLTFNNQVTLYKMASADLSGIDNYKGTESYAIASTSDDGTANISYRLVLRNDGQAAIENLRVLDKLPFIGDKEIASSTIRDSRWPVTLIGVTECSVADYTVYTTADAEVSSGGTSNYVNAISSGNTSGWSTSSADYGSAKAVRIDFGSSVKLQPGESLTITFACKAPTTQQATDGSAANLNTYYFWLANNTAVAASNLISDSIRSVVYSARASVMLNPATVSLGNRVWVDKNANGLQDVASAAEDIDDASSKFTLEPSLTGTSLEMKLRTFVGSDVSYTTTTTTTDANGFYRFDGLTADRIKSGSLAAAYDSAGNILNSALFGVRPTSYQLQISGLPEGYLVTLPYANNGGTYAPNYEHNSDAERQTDNNFQQKSSGWLSERFYLQVGMDNPSLDVGLIRYRNLVLTKRGTDGNLLDDATFAIYGPFSHNELMSAIDLDLLTPVATIVARSGVASFTSTSASSFLNYYSNYVVVETVSAAACYQRNHLTASGDHVQAADGYAAITGGGIDIGNFFVLTARDDTETGITEAVTVTNTYTASGSLQVTGTKTLTGGVLAADQFTFVMTSEDDPDFLTLTAANDADGHFAFAPLSYDYGDDAHTYHYSISERNDALKGITYDTQVYSLTVTVNNLGDGLLNIDSQLTDADGSPCSVIAFQNESRGTLRITKALAGNAPLSTDSFTFTLTLTDAADQPLSGTYSCVHSGSALLTSLTPDASGQVTVALKGGENIAITGLLTGTKFAVTEADARALGYLTTSAGTSGTIATDEHVNDVSFTNTRNVGNLTISKTLEGNAPDVNHTFTFEVSLSNANLPVNGTYACTTTGGLSQSAITFTGGMATLSLKGGQSLTIQGIYTDTAYTVTEADASADAYVPSPVTRVLSGTINAPTVDTPSALAAFTNRRDATTLTVRKTLAGNATDADKAFTFTLRLTGSGSVNINRTYPCAEGSAQTSVTFTGGSATLALKGGQYVTIQDIPIGTEYSVTEADYTADGYTTDYLPDADPHTLTLSGGEVTAVNTRNTYGGLVLSKTVAGAAASADKEFVFTLRLTRTDTLTVDGTYACERTLSTTGGTTAETIAVTGGLATLTLKANESLSIADILTGTAYTVTEADYRGDGYFPTPSTGIRSGVIYNEDQAYTASFVNTRGAGKLIIGKAVDGNAADTTKAFTFEVRFTRDDSIDVDGVYECDLTENGVITPTTLTMTDGLATVDLTHGQTLTIKAILRDTRYSVTETDYTADGYYTLPASRVISGTLSADEQVDTAAFTNTRNVGSLSVAKILGGNGASDAQSFTFAVTLSRKDSMRINQTYTCDIVQGSITTTRTITFVGGKANFSLIGGQKIIIYGIPTDTAYTVSENSYTADGYTTAYSGASGIIGSGQSSAAFTNTRWAGTLTLNKTLAGNATEADRAFTFTLTLADRNGKAVSGTFAATGKQSSVTFTNGEAQVKLKGSESVTVRNLLSGWSYSITEKEANTEGYRTSSTASSGVISSAGATVTFVNTRNVNQAYTRITVTKTWSDQDNRDGLRPTSVQVYLLKNNVAVDSRTLNESSNWTGMFENLPVFNDDGTEVSYRIVEGAIANYYATYQKGSESVSILNTHTPEVFSTDSDSQLTVIMTYQVPLGANMNMTQGDCIN